MCVVVGWVPMTEGRTTAGGVGPVSHRSRVLCVLPTSVPPLAGVTPQKCLSGRSVPRPSRPGRLYLRWSRHSSRRWEEERSVPASRSGPAD